MGEKAFNRAQRRASMTEAHGVRSGSPTGSTPHFTMWMADLKLKSILQRTKLNALAESAEGITGSALALAYVAGVKSVWDLSQLTADRLLGIRDLSIEHASALENYFRDRNVPLKWSVQQPAASA